MANRRNGVVQKREIKRIVVENQAPFRVGAILIFNNFPLKKRTKVVEAIKENFLDTLLYKQETIQRIPEPTG